MLSGCSSDKFRGKDGVRACFWALKGKESEIKRKRGVPGQQSCSILLIPWFPNRLTMRPKIWAPLYINKADHRLFLKKKSLKEKLTENTEAGIFLLFFFSKKFANFFTIDPATNLRQIC